MDFLYGYSESKLKPYLKMAVQRIQIATNKKSTSVKHQKREIAQLLADHKDEKARIKVEHIIREDFTIEAYEMLELLLELLHERIRQVTSNKDVPPDLKEAVCSLIWAASNVDISEFQEIKKQLSKKYGSESAKLAESNEGNVVNARLFQKLTYRPPSARLVMGYLAEIAKGYQVEWEPSESGLPEGGVLSDMPLSSPQGFSVPMAPASELRSVYHNTQATSSSSGGRILDPYEQEEQAQFRRHQEQMQLAQQAQQQGSEPVVLATLIADDSPSTAAAPHQNLPAIASPALVQHLPQQQQQHHHVQPVQPPAALSSPPLQTAVLPPETNTTAAVSTSSSSPPPTAANNPDPFLTLQARLAALHGK